MEEEPDTERGLPVVLRLRHRWVSRVTERKIEEAWVLKGPRQIFQEERPSHCSLRLHVIAHFLLHFCPCGFHDYFAGEGHVVDEDSFPQYLDAIRPVIKKALTLAALTSRFQTLLTVARKQSPMVKTPSATPATSEDTAVADEMTVPTTREKTPPPLNPADWLQWKSGFCGYRQNSHN